MNKSKLLNTVMFTVGLLLSSVLVAMATKITSTLEVLTVGSTSNSKKLRMDYINLNQTLTFENWNASSTSSFKAPEESLIELLVVVDKELGDKFNQDRSKVLDYLSTTFWDVNMRYNTIPDSNIRFVISGVVVIGNVADQPFIEESRADDGRAEFNRILTKFTPWVNENRGNLPGFDMAVLMTNANLEWYGGLAYVGAVCTTYNTGVYSDSGDWPYVTIGTHEIGHVMGSGHDPDDPNCQGFIMGGATEDKRFFFSPCSNEAITNYMRSDQASCVRRVDEPNPVLPEFHAPLAPTMEEQCKIRLRNPNAYVGEEDKEDCKVLKCREPTENGWVTHFREPLDNTPCGVTGDRRCFRGRCRPEGKLLVNIGTGKCLRAPSQLQKTVQAVMEECRRPSSPPYEFVVTETPNGKTLGGPYNTPQIDENGDRCLYTGNAEGGGIWTDICNGGENPWHGWDFREVGNGRFMLSHRVTGRCAKAEGDSVNTYGNCDQNDQSMLWTLE